MLRFLVLVLLAVALWYLIEWLYRKALRALGVVPPPVGGDRPGGPGERSTDEGRPEVLVRCGACGAYVPASRAVPVGRGSELLACSEVCRQRLRSGARR